MNQNLNIKSNSKPYPDTIFVIGGGRWARVIIETLSIILPTSSKINIITKHNLDSMKSWVNEKNILQEVDVLDYFPENINSNELVASIVVNAVRDHEKGANWAISHGIPTLIEKPISLSYSGAQNIQNLAREKKIIIASSQVFLYAKYIENYFNIVSQKGKIKSIEFVWTDLKGENRYGEIKKYDSSVPIFADCLPHIVSIIQLFFSEINFECQRINISNGGSYFELFLLINSIPCKIIIARNSLKRQRLLTVITESEQLKLDFSNEPGLIIYNNTQISGDKEWNDRIKPMRQMLTSFLLSIKNGELEYRLNYGIGLLACKLISEVENRYYEELIKWIIENFKHSGGDFNEYLKYAFIEILQYESTLSQQEINIRIKKLTEYKNNNYNESLFIKLKSIDEFLYFIKGIINSNN